MSNASTYYHGSHTGALILHVGLCVTDDADAAASYAQGEAVHGISLDMSGLRVVEVDGYDYDEDEAPGDRDALELALALSADVVMYNDADLRGPEHMTWRLLTPAALASVVVPQ